MNHKNSSGKTIISLIKTMRPSQWTKNIVVLAAFFFALGDHSRSHELGLASLIRGLSAMLLFCLASSGVYILNDIKDVSADRHHPLKKHRPIPAGDLPMSLAWISAIALLITACAGSFVLSHPLAYVIGTYIGIQFLYNLLLKQIAFLDIFTIAAGFILRAIAGAVVLNVNISPWLLLCTFLLALFLALCKRRHEKIQLADVINTQRPTLDKYDEQLLDHLISIISSATIVSYAIYTMSPDTVSKFGTAKLGFTIPFVLFGIFRYLDLVYRHKQGDRPEKILLTDMPLLVNIALYGIAIMVIFALQKNPVL